LQFLIRYFVKTGWIIKKFWEIFRIHVDALVCKINRVIYYKATTKTNI
jgi:hypothetical protein